MVIPANCTRIKVKMWGSSGKYIGAPQLLGGRGGYTCGCLEEKERETFFVEVADSIARAGGYQNTEGGGRCALYRDRRDQELMVAGGGGAPGEHFSGGAGGGVQGAPGGNFFLKFLLFFKIFRKKNCTCCQLKSNNFTGAGTGSIGKGCSAAGGGTQNAGGAGGSATYHPGHNTAGTPGLRIDPGRGSTALNHSGGVGGQGYYGGGSGAATAYCSGGGGGGSGFLGATVLDGETICGDDRRVIEDPDRDGAGDPCCRGKVMVWFL